MKIITRVSLTVFFVATTSLCVAKTQNVKSWETRFKQYYNQAVESDTLNELSSEFTTVLNSMDQGQYEVDQEVASKAVAQLISPKEALMHPRIAEQLAQSQEEAEVEAQVEAEEPVENQEA